MKKNIININDKEEWHGYVELYWANKLGLRCNYKNNEYHGYQEWHIYKQTKYYIT